jgi:aspartyl-tRNA(Asn)/glutamyl-tRNA(Gln) amidotransferase subunit A
MTGLKEPAASAADAATLTMSEAADLLRSGQVSSAELTRAALARADALDQSLGAYVTRLDRSAMAAATQADADFAAGIDRGPLQGIPLAVKDNLFTADGPTTAQSVVHDPAWDTAPDATVVARLRAAGAVITGKLTMSEFAIGPPGQRSPFPRPRNPWDVRCWPGGSSSGTATAVAAGLVFAGLGTDTAGSIRIPAAMCGLTGLKPAFGRVPVTGSIPLAPSLDHVGPIARSVRDCAAVLQVIAGYDPLDATSSRAPVPDYLDSVMRQPESLRIGVAPASRAADPAVASAFEAALAVFRSLGASVTGVELPALEATTAAAKLIMEAESFAAFEPVLRTRWNDLAPATRQRLSTGAFCGGADLIRAQRQCRTARDRLEELFAEVDVVVTPTMPVPPPELDPNGKLDPAATGMAITTTRYWNGVGYPALVLPMGFSAAGLPLSMHLTARPVDEPLLLSAGARFQALTTWHRKYPPLECLDRKPAGPPVAPVAGVAPEDMDMAVAVLARYGIDVGDDRDAMGAAYATSRDDTAKLRAAVGRRPFSSL